MPFPLRIAYLNTEYPSLSHTFIEREVRSVRGQGVEVETFSIRRPGSVASLDARNRRALEETHYVLGDRRRFLREQVFGLLGTPLEYLRTLWSGQRLSPPGIRQRLRHIVYSLEAVALARELRRRRLRHVHVHMANNGASVALLATAYAAELTYSLTVHGSTIFFNVEAARLRQKVEASLFTRCISDFCRAQVLSLVDPEVWGRTHVVHCGVEPDRIAPADHSPGTTFRMVMIGRLIPVKGFELALEACRRLSDAGVDWTLDLIGDGPIRGRLERAAGRLGIRDRVTFSGAVGQDRVGEHLDRADALVLSSFAEGVPVVLMEAMAKERCVIAPAITGIPELVENGVEGLLVRVASVGALAEAMRRLARSPEERERMGRAGRRKIVAEFSHPALGEQMTGLFQRYLGTDEPSEKREGEPPPPTRPEGRRYAIVTPCRNEEDHIEETIRTVAAQTVPPSRWVIVDDGSSDRTPEILARACEEHGFIRVLRREDRGARSVGPGVIDAFYAGLDTIDLDDYDYVCKLDADLELPARYFETVLEQMEADPLLGNFSGKVYLRNQDGTLEPERMGDENAIGAAKFYRVRCFREIGGFVRQVGWDGIDGHMCRLKGWIASSLDRPEIRIIHRRKMGSSHVGIWHGRKRWGLGKWYMGTSPGYILGVAAYRMLQRPYIIGGTGILVGYLMASLRGMRQHGTAEFRRVVRTFERSCLFVGKARALEIVNRRVRTASSRARHS